MNKNNLISTLLVIVILMVSIYFFPWKDISWGSLQINPSQTITLTGYAESREANQMASFSVGVDAVNDDRDLAVKEVNEGIAKIVESVKAFGIPADDIKTQSISIYKSEEPNYYGTYEQSKPTIRWRASNSIEIIVRDTSNLNDFSMMLSKTPATNFWGPNLSIGDSRRDAESDLLADAIADAKSKAEKIAKASGRKLGKLVNVSEGGTSNFYPEVRSHGMGGVGDMSIEPGMSSVSKSVVVTFELK